MTQAEAVFAEIRLKSSAPTFSGTFCVRQKTCATRVNKWNVSSINELMEIARQGSVKTGKKWNVLCFHWTDAFVLYQERNSMSHSYQDALVRFVSSMKHWFQSRTQECIRCSACEDAISPWASHCPTCGQVNPARVSATAGIYLAIGFV